MDNNTIYTKYGTEHDNKLSKTDDDVCHLNGA